MNTLQDLIARGRTVWHIPSRLRRQRLPDISRILGKDAGRFQIKNPEIVSIAGFPAITGEIYMRHPQANIWAKTDARAIMVVRGKARLVG